MRVNTLEGNGDPRPSQNASGFVMGCGSYPASTWEERTTFRFDLDRSDRFWDRILRDRSLSGAARFDSIMTYGHCKR